jgi:hypothetical protein
MAAPLVGIAAAAAAKLVAKKLAKASATKKNLTKTGMPKSSSRAYKQEITNRVKNDVRRSTNQNVTQGKIKVVSKVNKYYKKGGRSIGGPDIVSSKKGIKVVESMTGKTVKGKARKVFDNAQRTELEAKGYPKRGSVLKYPSKKILGNPKKPTTPKVPVKKKAK